MDSVIDMHQPLVSQVMRLDKKSYLEWISTPFLFSGKLHACVSHLLPVASFIPRRRAQVRKIVSQPILREFDPHQVVGGAVSVASRLHVSVSEP
jgi:hypothetical protein